MTERRRTPILDTTGLLAALSIFGLLAVGPAPAQAADDSLEKASAREGPAEAAATAPEDAEPAPPPVSDLELGLQEGSVFEAPVPPIVRRNQSFPGERPALLRAHPEAPPVTPHGTADFLPITRDQNVCTDCHLIDEKAEGGPTPIPESHFVDLRDAPGEVRDEIVGSRWVCTACHVAQTDNPPLVGNRVTGVEIEREASSEPE